MHSTTFAAVFPLLFVVFANAAWPGASVSEKLKLLTEVVAEVRGSLEGRLLQLEASLEKRGALHEGWNRANEYYDKVRNLGWTGPGNLFRKSGEDAHKIRNLHRENRKNDKLAAKPGSNVSFSTQIAGTKQMLELGKKVLPTEVATIEGHIRALDAVDQHMKSASPGESVVALKQDHQECSDALDLLNKNWPVAEGDLKVMEEAEQAQRKEALTEQQRESLKHRADMVVVTFIKAFDSTAFELHLKQRLEERASKAKKMP